MACLEEKELIEPIVILDTELEKVQEILDKIVAQLNHTREDENPSIWLSIDFEKVKQRIEHITAQIKEVQLKSDSE